jgi:hypothetical protein
MRECLVELVRPEVRLDEEKARMFLREHLDDLGCHFAGAIAKNSQLTPLILLSLRSRSSTVGTL